MSAVVFENVTKRYGKVVAVSSVSFTIAEGTLVTLLGPSGCGKTTTLRMIAGLELASEGRILIGGQDVTMLPATERDVTMVFQSYALFPHLTVLDNVAYGLRVANQPKEQAQKKAEEGLRTVGLEGFGARLPSELSGGQQQRVAVARALVVEPKVLLFDEPLSNLDARLRRKMRQDIRALQRDLGFSAVYVTHDQDEALSVSDEIILMDRAVIVQQGTPRELYDRPKTEFVARFIGDSNVVSGEVRGGRAIVSGADVAGIDAPDGSTKIAVRPNEVRFEARGLAAKVSRATYLGDHMEYTLETAAGELFVVDGDVEHARAIGTEAAVAFDRARVVGP
jgi:iron(III) transport system ATP-binding protein